MVYRGLRVAGGDALGKNAVYLACHPAGIVQVVDHEVQHHPARLFKINEPVVGRLFGLEGLSRQAKHGDLADVTAVYCRLGQGVFREEADDVGQQQLDPGRFAGGDHLLALLQGAGDGFFADDVLAGRRRLEHLLVVQVGGRADVYDIHVSQHGVQVRIGLGRIPLGQWPGAFLCFVQKAGDLGLRLCPGISVGPAHKADAGNAYAHGYSPCPWEDWRSLRRTAGPGCSLFDGAGGQAADQLPGEDDV